MVSMILSGSPDDVADELTNLAASKEILQIEKLEEKNKYIAVLDDSASASQYVYVVSGSPEKLKDVIDDILEDYSIDLVILSDFKNVYILVYR